MTRVILSYYLSCARIAGEHGTLPIDAEGALVAPADLMPAVIEGAALAAARDVRKSGGRAAQPCRGETSLKVFLILRCKQPASLRQRRPPAKY